MQWLKNALRQSLGKVELDSTSCNASRNKNVALHYDRKSHTPYNFGCVVFCNKIARDRCETSSKAEALQNI